MSKFFYLKKIYLKVLNELGIEIDNYLLYFTSGEKLPEVLTKKEEEELLKRINFDDNAKKIVIEKNLRLVVYIAKKFENSGVNLEDLISIGTIGLVKAVNSYKIDKNIKLATYASRCIENEILMYLRKNIKIKAEVSMDEPINIDSEGNDLSLSDILGSDIDLIFKSVEETDNLKLLKNEISKLKGREKVIMELRYGFNGKDELTQKEVAELLGISQSYISRIEKKVIKNLKKTFFV